MMHGGGRSDPGIVAVKPANKAERSAAELVEQRARTKGNADQQSTRRARGRASVAQSAGTHTASCQAKEEGKVHREGPPHQCRVAQASRSSHSRGTPRPGWTA